MLTLIETGIVEDKTVYKTMFFKDLFFNVEDKSQYVNMKFAETTRTAAGGDRVSNY
jgi:hypothetical protein